MSVEDVVKDFEERKDFPRIDEAIKILEQGVMIDTTTGEGAKFSAVR